MLKKFSLNKTIKRFLNLHEYQAAELLAKYKLPIPQGGPATTSLEAHEVAQNIKTDLGYVLKA